MGVEIRTEEGPVRVGTEECFQHLVEALSDPNPRIRKLGICGLAASGDHRAIEHIAALIGDPDHDVRTRAIFALGRLGDAKAAPSLIEAARSVDPTIHRAAIAALGELGPVAVDLLAAELRSKEPADRVRAAISLGETHDLSALQPLTEALEDRDATVRARAREAIEKIRESRVF